MPKVSHGPRDHTFANGEVAFKKAWHAVDCDLGAHQRYMEQQSLIRHIETWNLRSLGEKLSMLDMLRWLHRHPNSHRRILWDAIRARAIARLFFQTDFVESKMGRRHSKSMLLDQDKRARITPLERRRTSTTNKFRPPEFWQEWDDHWRRTKETWDCPLEWDIAIRVSRSFAFPPPFLAVCPAKVQLPRQ